MYLKKTAGNKLKAELDSSRRSRKKAITQQLEKDTNLLKVVYYGHVTDDEQLRSLMSQVTNGWRRGAIVDKELSLNGVTSARKFRTFEGYGSSGS